MRRAVGLTMRVVGVTHPAGHWDDMETIALTSTDITTTRLGFGCAGLMRLSSRRDRQDLLAAVLEQGVRHFDTARMYGLGAAEAELGSFARTRRDSITIATKFGIEPSVSTSWLAAFQAPLRKLIARFPALREQVRRRAGAFDRPHRYDAETARASLERSLRELQTDYVDILFLHGPRPSDLVDFEGVCAYLEGARSAGHLRAWGVSGAAGPSDAVRQLFPVPTVLQVQSDIFTRSAFASERPRPQISFGVLSSALPRIHEHVMGDVERQARWSDSIGADCSDQDVIASLLLSDALRSNTSEMVLYGSSRIAHVRTTIGAASDRAPEFDARLVAFRALVAEELTSERQLAGPAP